MLNFTKIKVALIYLILLFCVAFALLNLKTDNILNKKVNLGLDLQGGSYLLLEIDTSPLINQRLQNKVLPIKKLLKANKIEFSDFLINSDSIRFKILKTNQKKFENIFYKKKDNLINNFIDNYNTHELEAKFSDEEVFIKFSKGNIKLVLDWHYYYFNVN